MQQNLNEYFDTKFSKMDVIIKTKMNKIIKDAAFQSQMSSINGIS